MLFAMQERKRKETGIMRNDVESPNHVLLSLRFLVAFSATAILVSFTAGRQCRLMILRNLGRRPVHTTHSDYFVTSHFARMKRIDGERRDSYYDNGSEVHESYVSEKDNDIIPGQQLLVDIEHVDGIFLHSKHLLQRAITKYLEERSIHDVSFHPYCASAGVGHFCFVMLKDGGRITLNTWPLRGAISITILFNSSEETLISELEMVQRIFGIPKKRNRFGVKAEDPYMRWATRTRGFFEKVQSADEIDLKSYITSSLERPWKKKVASIETAYQRIEIYDMLHPRLGSIQTFSNMKNNPDSYEARNSHLFRPDRLVFLDGVMQSRFFGEAAYHESLVHPALLAHPKPRRVAIIGGGEGATMREVLKHNTVETVTMIDIDDEMVRFSQQFLPEWSDCSFLEGSDGSCYDDPRAEFFGMDAVAWFLNRYGEKEGKGIATKKYDVIIMDALDPDSKTPFSDVLYNNKEFVKALNNALTDDGIFILQTGVVADGKEIPAMYHEENSYERILKQNLGAEGFVRVYEYEEAHGGFLAAWTFMISFKSFKSERRWFANQAQVDKDLHSRAMPTKSGGSPFRYFDGATMVSFQLPSRRTADFKCKLDFHPSYCNENHGFDPNRDHFNSSSLIDLDASLLRPGSYIALDHAVNAIEFQLTATNVIKKLSRINSQVQTMEKFVNEFVAPMCIEGFTGVMDPFYPELAQVFKGDTSDGLFCQNGLHVWNERDIRTRRAELLHSQGSDLYAKANRCFVA